MTDVCRQLIHIFFATTALKKDTGVPTAEGSPAPRILPIEKVGILGAGFMGASVAYVTANAGLEVVLIDRDVEAAEKGKAHSDELITKAIGRGHATQPEKDALLSRKARAPTARKLRPSRRSPCSPTRR